MCLQQLGFEIISGISSSFIGNLFGCLIFGCVGRGGLSEEVLGCVCGVLPWDPHGGRRGKTALSCSRRFLSGLLGSGMNSFTDKSNKQPLYAACCRNPRGSVLPALKRLMSMGRAGSGEHQEHPKSRSCFLELQFGCLNNEPWWSPAGVWIGIGVGPL